MLVDMWMGCLMCRGFNSLNKSKFGAVGIGAMIVFIAMLLVAGIAASVLVSTSNTTQNQALSTGQQTTQEVSSGIAVYEISGKVNETGGTKYDINYTAIVVRARPGSGGIDLNNTFLLLSDGATKGLVKYGHANSSQIFINKASTQGDLFSLLDGDDWDCCNRETFGVAVIQDYDGSVTQYNPVINRGDKVAIFMRCGTQPDNSSLSGVFDSEISEREDIFGRVIPEVGAPGVISFTAPMSYVDSVYTLQ